MLIFFLKKELGPLIGKMLSRLSNLEGLTATLYASHVLPVLVDQITNCKDSIAQEYLMECMVQVFPDEYHLLTLGTVLETAQSLVEGVDVKSIVVNLTDRLVNFVKVDGMLCFYAIVFCSLDFVKKEQ